MRVGPFRQASAWIACASAFAACSRGPVLQGRAPYSPSRGAVAGGPQTPAPPTAATSLLAGRNGAAAGLFAPDTFAPVHARFVAFGDGGTGEADQYAVARGMGTLCRSRGCDFGLGLGDNFYPVGVRGVNDPQFRTAFELPYAPLGIPIYMILGNHDYFGTPEAEVAYARVSPSQRFVLPARYYTFFAGGIRFVALDTNEPSAAQEAWAKKVLAQSERNREPWVVALGHHPQQSYGAHQMPQEPLAGFLDRVLCGHVDAYFAGHDHDKQLLAPRCGVTQVVAGTAGQLRPVGSGPETIWARSSLGFAYVSVQGLEMKLEFIGANGHTEYTTMIRRSTLPVPAALPTAPTPASH